MAFLILENVTKLYKMGEQYIHALDSVCMKIDRGEYLAIMGPSGSGKSTMMNILGFLDLPDKGKYIFDGKDMTNMSESELAYARNKRVGFVFQTFNLLPRETALENVELPLIYSGDSRSVRIKKAKHALELVQLSSRIHHKPNELSGGERQRVAIARALVNNPDIILADEPTGNLDSKRGEEIMKVFEELNAQGRTVIIVTHDSGIANMARRIIRLRDGKIIEDIQNRS